MGNFIPVTDDLSELIEEKAQALFKLLAELDVDSLGMPYYCQEYFKGSHSKRLFFSIETSAHLLYRAIKICGKPLSEIVLMDYGAGVGTMYSLAKLIGCRRVVYNDFLKDWKDSAVLIAKAINVEVDDYIVGDIDDTLKELGQRQIICDIIVSRNVVEHVYKLDNFFQLIAQKQPGAIIYSSTTANFRNPLTQIQHRRIHSKWEKLFIKSRHSIITKLQPDWNQEKLCKWAKATRGLNSTDIIQALQVYKIEGRIPDPSIHRSNTCDPETGVWFEHLISFEEYRKLIPKDSYTVSFAPGLWDTHNKASWKNIIGFVLNPIIKMNSTVGTYIAPFIYVVAVPKHLSQKKNQ